MQSLCHIPRRVRLVKKTQSKNFHAWAPLTYPILYEYKVKQCTLYLYYSSYVPRISQLDDSKKALERWHIHYFNNIVSVESVFAVDLLMRVPP